MLCYGWEMENLPQSAFSVFVASMILGVFRYLIARGRSADAEARPEETADFPGPLDVDVPRR